MTATGGDNSAGIGSGYEGKFSSISITSGITSVTATMGTGALAPIGRGSGDSSSGTVTIDGTLTQTYSNNNKTLTLTKSQN